MYDHLPHILLFVIAFLFIHGLAIYAWRLRSMPGALPYAVHKAGIVLLLLSLLMASISAKFTEKLFWIRMYHSGTFLAMLAWLAFTLQITGRGRWLNRRTLTGALAVLGTALVILFSAERSGLYWNRIWETGAGVREVLGIWGRLIIDSGYLVLSVCTCLFWGRFLRLRGILRAQAGIMVFSTFVTITGHLCWRMGATPAIRQDALAAAFIISGLLDAFAFFKLRLFDIMPAAQAMVTRIMGDGLVVVDQLGIVVGVNSAAERIIGKSSPEVCGTAAGNIFGPWPELSGLTGRRKAGDAELVINGEFYNVRVAPLTARGVGLMGLAIVFHNISAEKEAQALLVQQEQAAAVIKERDRIGRELHDGQGQLVSYLTMQLEAARSWIARGRADQADALLQDLVGMTRGLHVDIRESITSLKSNLDQDGFLGTLSGYLEWFGRNYGIETGLMVMENVKEELFSPVGAVQLQRIIQEALTNVRKHAGALKIRVIVAADDNEVEIAVEDDGAGFDVAESLAKQGSYGLQIMMERAREIGASLRFDSRPQAGTSVKVTIPIISAAKVSETTGNISNERALS
jgi:signal transduction histidine kinase